MNSKQLAVNSKRLGAIGVFVCALVLYWPVLGMPLIYDTLLHLRIAEQLNWGNVWLPTEAFGFFRPMTFTPILLTRTLFGTDVAFLYNAMNLLQHAINAVLLFWLMEAGSQTYTEATQRDTNSRTVYRSLFTALLFTTFPFSYQAVAVYGHNVHPAVTGLILLGLLTSLRDSKRWRLVTAAIFIVGLLTHESFILFGVFGALIAFSQQIAKMRDVSGFANPETLLKATRPYWIYILLGVIYIIVYQFLPISRAPQVDEASGALWTKLQYVMQGVSHPIALFGKYIPLSAQTIILFAFALTVAFSIWRRSWLTLVGWGWWLLASALIVLPLPTGYLLNGPRLLYLGSVGVAIIWGGILTPQIMDVSGFANPETQPTQKLSFLRRQESILLLLPLLALIITNSVFVRARLTDYAELTRGIDVLRQESHDAIVLLNHPQWIAPVENVYPLGAEFVQQLGDYLFIEEWTTRNLAGNPDTWSFRVDELLATVPYGYGVHAQHVMGEWEPVESDWFLTRYEDDGTQFEQIGGLTESSDETLATFAPYRLVRASAESCPPAITIRAQWHNSNPTASSTLSLFIQLLDENGVLIGQNDAPPLRTRPDQLPSGNLDVVDLRTISVESDATPSAVLMGVYDYTTGERMGGVSADNSPLPDNALRLDLQPCP